MADLDEKKTQGEESAECGLSSTAVNWLLLALVCIATLVSALQVRRLWSIRAQYYDKHSNMEETEEPPTKE